MEFSASRCKIEWANQHIKHINELLVGFVNSDFYDLTIQKNVERGTNHLRFDFDISAFPSGRAALVIGDAMHNLRSALDILYYAVVLRCGGSPTKWTRFPIRDTRDTLVAPLNGALEKKQITSDVHAFILDTIQPYKTGNYSLWALDDLNIMDKHQLLVPVLKLMRFEGFSLEDDDHRIFDAGDFCILDEPCSIRLKDADDINLTVKEKGHASATILFDLETPFACQPIIPSLNGIAEEVTRTINAFELLLS